MTKRVKRNICPSPAALQYYNIPTNSSKIDGEVQAYTVFLQLLGDATYFQITKGSKQPENLICLYSRLMLST